jgi:hypothetical protein
MKLYLLNIVWISVYKTTRLHKITQINTEILWKSVQSCGFYHELLQVHKIAMVHGARTIRPTNARSDCGVILCFVDVIMALSGCGYGSFGGMASSERAERWIAMHRLQT